MAYQLIRPDSYVVLCVRDTGSGVSEQALNRLFEPFQAPDQLACGSGLELALVYAIVKEHQGFIDVRSAPGKGTAVIMAKEIRSRERRKES